MSSIEKMTIQGIRSYGPKDSHTQVIEFFFPVTLIIGQNGCGKTTIIESLKFATTSDMPPNTKGSSFVFDPKLINEIEAKGRIKLYFRDTSGMSVQVQKNLCSTQKAKKLEFRTAETIITRYNKEGKVASTITSKCINADAEVINAFGVSKAVLDHVIFCHQEDSNWPLSEGKILKTRFDEIFAATKYIKALDVLRKVRLEKQQLVKQKEIEKKFLEANKNKFEALCRDLEENQTSYNNLQAKKETCEEKMKPIQKQIEHYFKQSNKIFEIKGQLDKIENEKQLLEKQIKELLVLTKNCSFIGSDMELKQHVAEFDATTDKMRLEEEQAALKNIETLNSQLKILNSNKSKLIVEIGGLENKQKVN
jgi:DNA repair protein RAD50